MLHGTTTPRSAFPCSQRPSPCPTARPTPTEGGALSAEPHHTARPCSGPPQDVWGPRWPWQLCAQAMPGSLRRAPTRHHQAARLSCDRVRQPYQRRVKLGKFWRPAGELPGMRIQPQRREHKQPLGIEVRTCGECPVLELGNGLQGWMDSWMDCGGPHGEGRSRRTTWGVHLVRRCDTGVDRVSNAAVLCQAGGRARAVIVAKIGKDEVAMAALTSRAGQHDAHAADSVSLCPARATPSRHTGCASFSVTLAPPPSCWRLGRGKVGARGSASVQRQPFPSQWCGRQRRLCGHSLRPV